jgi:hypothetical protein
MLNIKQILSFWYDKLSTDKMDDTNVVFERTETHQE